MPRVRKASAPAASQQLPIAQPEPQPQPQPETTVRTSEMDQVAAARDALYADLDEYQQVDALYNEYQKKREALGSALKDRLSVGTFVIDDLTVTKSCTVAHSMDKKIVEKLLKDIGRQDIIDAAMTETSRVSLSVKRVARL